MTNDIFSIFAQQNLKIMGRSRRKKPFYENVLITDIGAEGKAIAKVNDVVVFVTHVIPGDVVDIQITKKRKNIRKEG